MFDFWKNNSFGLESHMIQHIVAFQTLREGGGKKQKMFMNIIFGFSDSQFKTISD